MIISGLGGWERTNSFRQQLYVLYLPRRSIVEVQLDCYLTGTGQNKDEVGEKLVHIPDFQGMQLRLRSLSGVLLRVISNRVVLSCMLVCLCAMTAVAWLLLFCLFY